MEVLGAISSSLELVKAANDVRKAIQRLRLNSKRRTDLTCQVDKLLEILQPAQRISGPAEEFVGIVVQEVKVTLDSLAEEAGEKDCLFQAFSRVFVARKEANKLDEVEGKLKNLTTQVVVVGSVFQLTKERPSVWNLRFEPPKCKVGLDRANEVFDFLQTSLGQEFRVVCIQGLPGVGKTTILNFVWNQASSAAPFASRAHVQIGSSINDHRICSLQSAIFEQLSGGEKLAFTAPEGGKAKLSEHLQQLKGSRKPVFLAIDNVLEGGDLTKLLPVTLWKDIPASSVIAITCRTYPVVRALLSLCHLDKQINVSQVYHSVPTCLSPADSRTLFAECGGLSYDADADLLESLVPLCGGFPLALCVLGRHFADSAKRSREEWELIKEQMERLDGDDSETSSITKALQVMYDQLNERRKAAFCELVMCFYGWKWERVERILGKSALNYLKESSLISEAEDWFACNQSALSEGYDMDDSYCGQNDRRVITMHDLTFRFGQGLCANLMVVESRRGYRLVRGLFQRLEASKLRHFILQGVKDQNDPTIQFLEEAANLQTLYLSGGNQRGIPFLKACSYKNIQSMDERPSLHSLRLDNWKRSTIVMQSKLSYEIREIYLSCCQDLEQLPDMPLPNLEVLSIHECDKFQHFSPSSVSSWRSLKYLHVESCPCLTSLPADLGRLDKLSDLSISSSDRLQALPTLSCPLQKLVLSIPAIANFELEKTACLRLQDVFLYANDLPSSVWNAPSIKKLEMMMGEKVEVLLPASAIASSLQSLTLRAPALVKLPEDMGSLAMLTRLNLCGCRCLKRLSPSIGNATSLKYLWLSGCESLVELPDEVGNLTALTDLDLRGCKSLKGLPPTIGKATSLDSLTLEGCESLVGLPDEVGELGVLRELNLLECKSLKGLPPAIVNAVSLQALRLGGCDLVELEEVGKLTALTELNLFGCRGLKGLPAVLKKVASLCVLELDHCESLPDEVGKLSALTELSLSRCWSMKRLAPAIGKVTSLQILHLDDNNMVELPDEVGELVALLELRLTYCKRLKRLPSTIGNAVSLLHLRLAKCDKLVELPEEVGKLTALTKLQLDDCKRLKTLPLLK